MSRWIDAEWLIEEVDGNLTDSIAEGKALEKIDEAPSIDIVRCSECVHWQSDKFFCDQWTCGTPAVGWCYMGKATVSKMEQVGTTEDCSEVGKE